MLTTKFNHDKLNSIQINVIEVEGNMEPIEKDIVIKKIMELEPEQVSKVLIFIAGLEAGRNMDAEQEKEKD